jgi:putative oxidoreductase
VNDSSALIGRALLVSIFLMSGFGKLADFGGTTAYIAAKGLTFPALGTALAIVIELGAGLLVLVGWKARWAALAIAIFSVVAAMFFHAYWAEADAAARMGNFVNFWKNISIAGGFLLVYAFGPGRYSVDRAG